MAKAPKKHKTVVKAKLSQEELAASKLVMITGNGHRISKAINMEADCGKSRRGWHYGRLSDVTCWGCLTPDERINSELFVVPPGQFEVDEVLKELGVV